MAVFAWQEFLQLAEQMEADRKTFGMNEAIRRSAASRAYYSCYHEAESMALARGYVHSSRNNHAQLITWLLSQQNQTLCTMGGQLLTLKKQRVHADYCTRRFSPHNAKQAVSQAREFIALAHTLTR